MNAEEISFLIFLPTVTCVKDRSDGDKGYQPLPADCMLDVSQLGMALSCQMA